MKKKFSTLRLSENKIILILFSFVLINLVFLSLSYAQEIDPDDAKSYCDEYVGPGHWNPGYFEAKYFTPPCCGDDFGEHLQVCKQAEGEDICDHSVDDDACCEYGGAIDCVYENKCIYHGSIGDFDGDGDEERCNMGVWEPLGIQTRPTTTFYPILTTTPWYEQFKGFLGLSLFYSEITVIIIAVLLIGVVYLALKVYAGKK